MQVSPVPLNIIMGGGDKLLRRAAECHQRGDLAGAARHYRKYLEKIPGDAEGWHTLGGMEFQRGRISEAVNALEKAAALRPHETSYLNDLAGLYLTDGRLMEAEQACRDLLKNNPDYLPASYNLALIRSRQGRLHECAQLLREITARKPDWAAAHYNLGVALVELGDYDAALPAFKMAVQLEPYMAAGHFNLARTLRELAFVRAAIDHLRKGLEIDPDNVDAIIDLADLLADENEINEAMQLLETARSRHPQVTVIPTTLGALCHRMGEARRAEFWFDSALTINPLDTSAIFGRAQVRRYTDADRDWPQILERQLSDANISEGQQSALHFALGKIHNDLGDYDTAFAHFQAANDAIHKTTHYDRRETEAFIDNTIRIFTKDFIDKLRAMGSDSDLPVFVVGMPRSGTTLVEQIIASHPQAHGAGELRYFTSIYKRLPQLLRSSQSTLDCISTMTPAAAANITGNYLALLRRHSATALRIVNKTPGNFIFLGLIAGLFPDARIIHCTREPLDVCLSIYFQSFKEGHDYSWDLLDIGHYYRLYARLMRHWRAVMPDRFLDVNYEELVAGPEAGSRRLIGYCGLPWDDQCLRFYETKREVKTASLWQVRQPIYKTSAGRWQNYAKYLGPLQELLAGESP